MYRDSDTGQPWWVALLVAVLGTTACGAALFGINVVVLLVWTYWPI